MFVPSSRQDARSTPAGGRSVLARGLHLAPAMGFVSEHMAMAVTILLNV